MERDLCRLGECADEQPGGDDIDQPGVASERDGLLEDAAGAVKIERAGVLDQQEEREGHRRIADGVDDEGLLGGRDGARPLVPETDQQVGGEPDQAPADKQYEEVGRLDEEQHREDEEGHVGEVTAFLVLALHVADRVGDDQRADARDDEHHHQRQWIDEQVQLDLERVRLDQAEGCRDRPPVACRVAERGQESGHGRGKGDQRRRGGQVAGGAARHAVSAQGDREHRGQRSEQANPGGSGDHV